MKCLLLSIVSAEIVLHGFLWLSLLASWEAVVWGIFMQSLYFRLVSNFPKIEFRSPLFVCVCGKDSVSSVLIQLNERVKPLFAVGSLVHEVLWLFHSVQEHSYPKGGSETCFSFRIGSLVVPVSFCPQNIVLILLSVWAMPLILLFCSVDSDDETRFPTIVINFVGFGSAAEAGLADFDGG